VIQLYKVLLPPLEAKLHGEAAIKGVCALLSESQDTLTLLAGDKSLYGKWLHNTLHNTVDIASGSHIFGVIQNQFRKNAVLLLHKVLTTEPGDLALLSTPAQVDFCRKSYFKEII
jgi:hypothetical protein